MHMMVLSRSVWRRLAQWFSNILMSRSLSNLAAGMSLSHVIHTASLTSESWVGRPLSDLSETSMSSAGYILVSANMYFMRGCIGQSMPLSYLMLVQAQPTASLLLTCSAFAYAHAEHIAHHFLGSNRSCSDVLRSHPDCVVIPRLSAALA